ncbi:helix-turn-helix transcriptional regulator [Leeuwenhoekiella marinoflava]|uniref:DNA-binding XRE family transcriptional regulator n=2 Tax=Leeuwenhoekiella marinoflava TaxID=988 RepID=A0A4Q0PNU3_9FLAO|nr:helix-turn-helix transcriptional regulator [Leeuwenhoekiella marinoflava]RXG31792.1 DNA-binding XRE family transcriptional regulator [Leeuwenhoekiella marinoflava]SHF04993.1 DNA-binding transcriptional regulator, XRE-family HTH domain [Leeuwenhoekiella marinoflava DSM 3653]
MQILRIKELLDEQSINSRDLAKAVGVSPVSIYNIVNGESFPRPELLKQIAEVLDVDIRQLFNSTKPVAGAEGVLNGFIEFQGKVYRINSIKDLEELNKVVNQ